MVNRVLVTGGPYSGVIKKFIDRLRLGEAADYLWGRRADKRLIYVEDAVEANMLVLGCQHCVGEVINIGTGKPTTVNELANVLMELFKETGAKPEYVPPRGGDIRHSYADISKAERVLGYKSRIGLEEGIKLLLEGLGVRAGP